MFANRFVDDDNNVAFLLVVGTIYYGENLSYALFSSALRRVSTCLLSNGVPSKTWADKLDHPKKHATTQTLKHAKKQNPPKHNNLLFRILK